MRKARAIPAFISENAGSLAVIGALAAFVPLLVAVLSVRWDPLDFCRSREPEGIPSVGEGVSIGWSLHALPFGIECRYGNPAVEAAFHDFGTPFVVGGILLLLAPIVGVVLRHTILRPPRHSRPPGKEGSLTEFLESLRPPDGDASSSGAEQSNRSQP